jgi:hypothetical protein
VKNSWRRQYLYVKIDYVELPEVTIKTLQSTVEEYR